MKQITKQTAWKILYWHLTAFCLTAIVALSVYTRNLHRYDSVIVQISRAHQVDPRLVSTLIWKESRFNPSLHGSVGEIGLMQISMVAAQDWSKAHKADTLTEKELFEVQTNIRVGIWYLARAIKYWEGRTVDPLPFALAEYNAGRKNAIRWAQDIKKARPFWEQIGYPTTKRYVRDILVRYRGKV